MPAPADREKLLPQVKRFHECGFKDVEIAAKLLLTKQFAAKLRRELGLQANRGETFAATGGGDSRGWRCKPLVDEKTIAGRYNGHRYEDMPLKK